jgi:hypothetical protein
MRSDHSPPSTWSVAGLYLFGILLFFWPFTDLVSNALPVQLGNLHWRYGFGGLLAAYLNTPILGLILLMAVAYWLGHTRTLRFLSVLELLMAVGLLVVMVIFALDMIQVRASRPEAARPAVLAGGTIAIAKHLTAAVVLALLGIGGWRTAGRCAEVARKQAEEGGASRIVMKRRGSAGPSEISG